MTDRPAAEHETTRREAAHDGSRGQGARPGGFWGRIGALPGGLAGVLAIGILAGLLLIATEPSTIASVELTGSQESCETQLVDPEQRDRCELSGFERHGGALILLGLLAIAMAAGASLGASRPAAAALIAIGVVALALGLISDLPELDETGAIGATFEGAEASPGTGFYFEIVGGLLAIAAGALRLTRRDEPAPAA